MPKPIPAVTCTKSWFPALDRVDLVLVVLGDDVIRDNAEAFLQALDGEMLNHGSLKQ
jgi:hypothetical protein